MKKINIVLSIVALLCLAGCQGYLDREAKTTMDDGNFWTSEQNIRLFVNGAYGSYFTGYSDNWGQVYAPGVYSSGEFSDDRTNGGTQPNILISLPSDNWYRQETNRGYWLARRGSAPWNFAYIRKWNLLLDRLKTMKENGILAEEAYNHWSGVARFFRGWEYSRFVQSFGDVPYYAESLTSADTLATYKDRDPRTLVMDAVMEDFDYAIANVRLADGQNYVNRYVVGTIASRCMLFEGSWYVYHKNDEAMKTCTDVTGHAKTYLGRARDYAQFVIDSKKFSFDTDFRTLFGTLYKTPKSGEILLYREYNKTVNNGAQHCISSYSNGDENQVGSGNLSTLKAWICNDGQPYATTTVANGKSWRLQDMVKTRDPRFEATFWDEPKPSDTGLYTEKFTNRQGVTFAYNGETRPTWCASCTNENGFPCVRYAETVLNWIEAKAELADKFGDAAVTQDDLDKSINAIRKRPLDDVAKAKGVKQTAPLLIAALPNDPERVAAPQKTTLGYKTTGFVPELLWEIRRERRMEFFMEQYRVLDIRRWGQLELMLGANNPDLLVGGWVELDLARRLVEQVKGPDGKYTDVKDADGKLVFKQNSNLKKTLNNQGYNLLTLANSKKVSVMHIEGYNPDGTLKLGERIYFEVNGEPANANLIDDTNSNCGEMQGFLVPVNVKDRDTRNVEVRNYLEPICSDVIQQYAQKHHTIYQNPGW